MPFEANVQTAIAVAADELGYTRSPLMSGAGDNAQEIAETDSTAPLFIPGECDGIATTRAGTAPGGHGTNDGPCSRP